MAARREPQHRASVTPDPEGALRRSRAIAVATAATAALGVGCIVIPAAMAYPGHRVDAAETVTRHAARGDTGESQGGKDDDSSVGRRRPPVAEPTPEPTTAATSTPEPTATVEPTTPVEQSWAPLRPGTSWQLQLDGETVGTNVFDAIDNDKKMYDLDMETADAESIAGLRDRGIYVVCYVEMGGWESYRSDASAYPESVLGNGVDGYPEERFVDIRQIDVLRPIIAARLDAAASKGCQGIDPDLDDTYALGETVTGFPLTREDQIAFNSAMVAQAHARGMSMGLKNGPDIAEEMSAIADFAVNESCNVYDECDSYLPFIEAGKAVFNVEYTEEGMGLDDFCPADNAANIDGLLKYSSSTLHALPREACRFE